MRDDFRLEPAHQEELRTESGWYFMQTQDRWEKYGPYTGSAAGIVLKKFRADGGETRVGDRIYIAGTLYELADSGPPRVVAEGRQAEQIMQDMQTNGYRY